MDKQARIFIHAKGKRLADLARGLSLARLTPTALLAERGYRTLRKKGFIHFTEFSRPTKKIYLKIRIHFFEIPFDFKHKWKYFAIISTDTLRQLKSNGSIKKK
jgi:hypothetical protein